MILWDAHFEVPCPINVHVQNNNYCTDVENKQFGVMGHDDLLATLDTRATPNKPAAPALKNTSPTYSEGIQGWDLWWLELLELLVAGG
jgi:hypothetical protein